MRRSTNESFTGPRVFVSVDEMLTGLYYHIKYPPLSPGGSDSGGTTRRRELQIFISERSAGEIMFALDPLVDRLHKRLFVGRGINAWTYFQP